MLSWSAPVIGAATRRALTHHVAAVISTGDPVLPGARGHVVVSEWPSLPCSFLPAPSRGGWPSPLADPSELRRFGQSTGTSPVPRRGAKSPCRAAPASNTDLARLTGWSRPAPEAGPRPCSTWLRGRSRRHLQVSPVLQEPENLADTPPSDSWRSARFETTRTRRGRCRPKPPPRHVRIPPDARCPREEARGAGTARRSRSDRAWRASVWVRAPESVARSLPIASRPGRVRLVPSAEAANTPDAVRRVSHLVVKEPDQPKPTSQHHCMALNTVRPGVQGRTREVDKSVESLWTSCLDDRDTIAVGRRPWRRSSSSAG
jgi:hypothetical protein